MKDKAKYLTSTSALLKEYTYTLLGKLTDLPNYECVTHRRNYSLKSQLSILENYAFKSNCTSLICYLLTNQVNYL